jgi:natural product precursor
MKTTAKKQTLKLNKETLKTISTTDLNKIVGGNTGGSCGIGCAGSGHTVD